MFGQAMNPVIRSDGSPKFAMIATVSGAITNVILDPIFVYGFHWGMMGAAVATVIGQVLTAALSIWYLRRMKVIKLEKSSFRLDWKLIPKFLVLGLTSFLAQISLVISMAAVQNMCMKYGAKDPIFGQPEYAQIPLAVLGIVMKFFQIAISIAIGMAAGCIPIAGYNIGAKKKDRAKALFSRLLLAEFIVGAVALVIVEVFPLQIATLFGAANESAYYADFTVKCFRIEQWSFAIPGSLCGHCGLSANGKVWCNKATGELGCEPLCGFAASCSRISFRGLVLLLGAIRNR